MARGPRRPRCAVIVRQARTWRALLFGASLRTGCRRSWSIPCRVRSTSVRTSRWTPVVVHRPTTTTIAAWGSVARARALRSSRSSEPRLGATVQIGRDVRHDERMASAQDVDDLIGDDGGQGGPFLATAEAAEEVVPGALVRRGRRQVRRWRVAEGLGQFEDAIVARPDAVTEVLVGVEGEVGQQGAGLAGVVGGEGLGHRRRGPTPAGPVTATSRPSDGGSAVGSGRGGRLGRRRAWLCNTAASASWSKSAARTASGSSRSRVVSRPGPSTTAKAAPARRTASASTRSTPGSPASTMARSTVARGEQCPQLLGGHAGGGVQGSVAPDPHRAMARGQAGPGRPSVATR